MKVAICIGHEPTSPGAYSEHLGMSEFEYNSKVAACLPGEFDIYFRPEGNGYHEQMEKLSEKINKKDYDLVVGLHFNSYEEVDDTYEAEGCEVVIYEGNERTEELGQQFCDMVEKEYGSKNRGVKTVNSGGDRGFWFLALMEANAIILEPFFGDEDESLKFKNEEKYAKLIDVWLCK